MSYSHVADMQRQLLKHHTRLRTTVNCQSSRCGKNASSVAGRKGHRKGEAEKEKPNTCQSVGFVGCPLGGRKNGIKLTLLQREAAVMRQQHHPCSPGACPGRWLQ